MNKQISVAIVVGLLGLVAWLTKPLWNDWGQIQQELVYYDVVRSDLPIVVTERGYLESQEQTSIRCRVELYDRRTGASGSTILSIIPNGSLVTKGDLLIELDSATIRDLLESETLELQSDRSTLIQAQARKENRETQNETAVAEAELALKLAKLNRKMYVDENSGTFKLSLSEIERQIDESRNAILEAQAALKLQETEKDGIEQLFRQGYRGKSDLEQSRYSFMKSEAALAAAVNRLANNDATRNQLETYMKEMELMKLDGEVQTALRNLEQVKVTNESELAQVNAQLFESKERVQRQEASIARYQRQLDYCTIRAPHAGMVVYAQNDEGNISVGVGRTVRSRQELLTLPDLSRMRVRTQIHEGVLDQVERGLKVTLRIDAFPNKQYQGIVERVAVVPKGNSNGVKTYECLVQIPTEVDKLKPGMTAVSEINLDRLVDVLSLPVQAIVQIDGETWCYVNNGNGVERRIVELGRNNDRFVEIVKGIDEGDRAVLNPMTIVNLESRQEKTITPETGEPPLEADSVPIQDQEQLEKAPSQIDEPKNQRRKPARGQRPRFSQGSDS